VAGPAAVELLDLEFLDMGAVGQHRAGQVDCRRGCVDGAGEALLDELRQQAGMIDMRVAEDHRRDLTRREGEGPVVQLLLGL
jgi:hypothetical protein